MNLIQSLKHRIAAVVPSRFTPAGRAERRFMQKRERLLQLAMTETASGVCSESGDGLTGRGGGLIGRGDGGKGRRKVQLVVSLTSYGKRVEEAFVAIESIMQGTEKPDRIVLWLEEGLKAVALPEPLKRQQQRGLEVRYTPDIRSYKKLIPALQTFPDCMIITIDDDVAYPEWLVADMLAVYAQHPDSVLATQVLQMKRGEDGRFATIREWPYVEQETDDTSRFFTEGFGGVLYPPHCFTDEVLREDLFMQLCPTADDVWFNAMVRVAGREVRWVHLHPYDFLANVNPKVQDMALYLTNNGEMSMNDRQIAAVWGKYGL